MADVLAAFHDLEDLKRRYGSLEASRPMRWAGKLDREGLPVAEMTTAIT